MDASKYDLNKCDRSIWCCIYNKSDIRAIKGSFRQFRGKLMSTRKRVALAASSFVFGGICALAMTSQADASTTSVPRYLVAGGGGGGAAASGSGAAAAGGGGGGSDAPINIFNANENDNALRNRAQNTNNNTAAARNQSEQNNTNQNRIQVRNTNTAVARNQANGVGDGVTSGVRTSTALNSNIPAITRTTTDTTKTHTVSTTDLTGAGPANGGR